MNTNRRTRIVLATLLLAVGCASIPVKQRVVVGSQAVETVLGAAQDFERAAFAQSTIPGLTAAKHQAFAGALSKAFDAQIKLNTALVAWRSGEPAPATLAELQTDVNDAFAVAQSLLPAGGRAADLLAKVQAVLNEAAKLSELLKGVK